MAQLQIHVLQHCQRCGNGFFHYRAASICDECDQKDQAKKKATSTR